MRRLFGTLAVISLVAGLGAACAPAAAPSPTPAAAAQAVGATPSPKPAPTSAPPALPTPTAKPEKVVLVIPSSGFADLFTIIAQQQAFYREEGFEVDKQTVKSDVGIKALIAGDVEFSRAIGSVLRGAATGLPIKGIMAAQNRPPWLLVARPEFKTIADLKGKGVALENVGGSTHVVLKTFLRQAGMDPEKDVTPLNLGDNANRLAAVKGGSAQGAILEIAYAIKAEGDGMRILGNAADITEQIMGGLGTSDKRIKENPDQVLRFVRAHVKALNYIKDPKNRDKMIDVMAKELNLTKDEATKTYDMGMKGWSMDGTISDAALQVEIDNAKAEGGITKDIPVSQIFDPTFVNKLKAGASR